MAKYRIKTNDVDALEFTPAMGEEVIEYEKERQLKGPIEVPPHKSGVTYEEGHGFRCAHRQLSFGDFIVRSSEGVLYVVSKADFNDRYEPIVKVK